jgi:hypothetical protein
MPEASKSDFLIIMVFLDNYTIFREANTLNELLFRFIAVLNLNFKLKSRNRGEVKLIIFRITLGMLFQMKQVK